MTSICWLHEDRFSDRLNARPPCNPYVSYLARAPPQVKTWFQNRRMKHKKQLRKAQDDRKTPGEMERSADNSSESELNDKSAEELKHGLQPDSYLLEENDDDVDIEDDICSPDHLL